MSQEIGELKITGIIDVSDWDKAPAKFDKVAQQISQKASQLSTRVGAPSVGRDAATGRFTQLPGLQEVAAPRGIQRFTLGGVAPIEPVLPKFAQPKQELAAALQNASDPRFVAMAQATQQLIEQAKTRAAVVGQSDRWKLTNRLDEAAVASRMQAIRKAEDVHTAITRVAATSRANLTRQAMEGALRGGGMGLLQGTGIRFPFLGLGPAFVGAAIATSALVAALKASIGVVLETGKASMTLSSGLNLTRQESAKLLATGQQFNVTTDNMQKGLLHLADETKTNYPLFQRLGVAIADSAGNLRSYADIAADARKATSEIMDPAAQAAVAVALYGDSAAQLKPYWSAAQGAIDGSGGSISAQTAAILRATQATAQWDTAVGKLKTSLGQLGQTAAPAVSGFADFITNLSKNTAPGNTPTSVLEQFIREHGHFKPSTFTGPVAGAGNTERMAAGLGQGGAQPFAPGSAGAAGAYELNGVAQFSTTLESLREGLLGTKDAAVAAGQGLLDIEHSRISSQQAIDSMIQDRAMQVAEQTAALTISLGDFNKTEQTTAQRARSQEKSFFAFRPDNALVRADQEIRYQRDLAIAKQQQTWQSEALTKQETTLEEHTALFQLQHGDLQSIQKELDANSVQLIAAIKSETPQSMDINVTLDGSGIDWTKFGLTKDEAIQLLTSIFRASQTTIRSASGTGLRALRGEG